jgi:hypothetical protein
MAHWLRVDHPVLDLLSLISNSRRLDRLKQSSHPNIALPARRRGEVHFDTAPAAIEEFLSRRCQDECVKAPGRATADDLRCSELI